jgi:protein-disulfide isomerase
MKNSKILPLLTAVLLLTACVDTTGIKPESSKTPTGNPNASVTVTEYSDFQCPACRVAFQLIVQPILQKYGSQIRFEYRQFPLLTIHPYSMPLAEASECAADQGKFWQYADKAFTTQLQMDKDQKEITAADITTWAKDLGLNMDLFDRCTRSHIKRKAILSEFDQGQKLGVQGTPTFFVNGKQVQQNDLATFEAAIDEALKGAAGRKL